MFTYKGTINLKTLDRDFIPGIPARDLSDTEAKKYVDALNLSKEQMKELGSWENALTKNGLYVHSKKKPKNTEA